MIENTSARESAGPPEHQVLVQNDEIDLVDLWLFFWGQRKIFFSSTILVVVVGIVGFMMFYEPRQVSMVRSLIEVDDRAMDQAAAPVLSSAALAKRIEYVNLPQLAALPEYELIKPYILETNTIPVEGTDIVQITSEITGNDTVDLKKFQSQLVEQIYTELSNSSYSLSGKFGDRLEMLNRSVTRLRQLIRGLDREAGLITEPRDVSYQLFLNQLGERKIAVSNELDDLSLELSYLESVFRSVEPSILVRAEVSSKTVGIKPSTAYSLIILLAIFLAIFIVVGAAFMSKVQKRMAGRD